MFPRSHLADLEGPRRAAFAVAYRMLGTVHDAEDIAQEVLARLSDAADPIANAEAWATTVATRLSIDVLRSARVQRETYIGPWLPEPLLSDASLGPAAQFELADSLSQALLVALERLTPVERAAFLLREVFDYDYAQIAPIIDRSETNARQLVTRAKKHVEAGRPRFDADEEARDRLFTQFLSAVDEGDFSGLELLLAEEVVLWGDGGGKVMSARIPVEGRANVARFLIHTTRWIRKEGTVLSPEIVRVNGQPGVIFRQSDGLPYAVTSVDVVGGGIATIRMMRNPDKLAHLIGGDAR